MVFGFSFGSFLICHICIWCSNSSVTVIIFVKGLERNTDQWLLLGCYYWKWITAMTTSMYVCVSLPFNFLFLSLFLFKGSVSWEKNTLWELHLVSNMYFLSFMLFNFCSVVLFGAWSRFPWNSWDFAWNISVFFSYLVHSCLVAVDRRFAVVFCFFFFPVNSGRVSNFLFLVFGFSWDGRFMLQFVGRGRMTTTMMVLSHHFPPFSSLFFLCFWPFSFLCFFLQ